MNWLRSRCVCGAVFCGAVLMICVTQRARAASPETLLLGVFIGEADSWDVTSTLIYGKSEAILVACQFRISQAKNPDDQLAARGRRLKAIIVTHPDNDHDIGTAVLR
jgi:glyoxylase-like metal-dependent hydrolase (beta-lactamase superfamily II)